MFYDPFGFLLKKGLVLSIISNTILLNFRCTLLTLNICVSFHVLGVPSLAISKDFAFNVTISTILYTSNRPFLNLATTMFTNFTTKVIAKFLRAGTGVRPVLTKVLAVDDLCAIGVAIVNTPGMSLVNGGEFCSNFTSLFNRGDSKSLPGVVLTTMVYTVYMTLLVVFFGAILNLYVETAKNGGSVMETSSVGASVAAMATLTVSGTLITLSNTIVTRARNFTSMGSNDNVVIVNLTSMVVNRIVFNGHSLSMKLISTIINSMVCEVVITFTLRAGMFSTGTLGLLSTIVITMALSIPTVGGTVSSEGVGERNVGGT